MARPSKQMSVTPEMRRKWLEWHNEDGVSPPKIAEKEGYDIRTVRKQLDTAREEKERRGTRLIVLRDAMQAHYADLCKRASQLQSSLDSGALIRADDRMILALRQHLSKSPLWKLIEKLNQAQETILQLETNINAKLADLVGNDSGLGKALSGGEVDMDGIVGAMAHQLDAWSRGSSGLEVESNFKVEPVPGDRVIFRYDAWPLGSGKAQQTDAVRKAIADLEKKIAPLPEHEEMIDKQKQARELKADIQEELETITLRRVLPGRCKYCPI